MASEDASYTPKSPGRVLEKTGRSYAEWFRILDDWGAPEKGHKLTAELLATTYAVAPWWSQFVTVEYERARGLRDVGQRSGGKFGTSAQRTVTATPTVAFEAVMSRFFAPDVAAGLTEGGKFRTVKGNEGVVLVLVPPTRLRLRWDRPVAGAGSIIEVTVEARDDARATIRLEHDRIPSKELRDKMKAYWKAEMDALAASL